jgi:hypothetical protein
MLSREQDEEQLAPEAAFLQAGVSVQFSTEISRAGPQKGPPLSGSIPLISA